MRDIQLAACKKHEFSETSLTKKIDGVEETYPMFGMSIITTPERNAAAKEVLSKMWDLIMDKEHPQISLKHFHIGCDGIDQFHPEVSECLINLKGIKKIKAVVFCTSEESCAYKPMEKYMQRGLLNAVVMKGILKKEFNHDVPLVWYEETQQSFKLPVVKEIVLEKDKLIEAINKSEERCRKGLLTYCAAAIGVDLKKEFMESKPWTDKLKGIFQNL